VPGSPPKIKMETQSEKQNQKPDDLELSSLHGSILATSIFALLFVFYLCRKKREGKINPERLGPHLLSTCKSLNCLRCHGEDTIRNKLMQRCREYVMEVDGVRESVDDYLSQHYPRVVGAIRSIDDKHDLLRRVYKESGDEMELSEFQPHIWTLPGLKREPVWKTSECEKLQSITACFETKSAFKAIQSEYELVSQQTQGWKINSIPSGEWRVFHFFNQGSRVEANCARCPQTTQLLQSISSFMKNSAFGNAMFSVLKPGSHIEIHTGPCNFRLRCHLPLCAPDSYKIRVGTIITPWQVSKLMVFDDSHVHTVWHDGKDSNGEQTSRVLLIFDVWHPEVNQQEQDILNVIFSRQ